MPPAQHIKTEDTLKRLFRAGICRQCLKRRGLCCGTRGTEEPLECESRCPIFTSLPTLTKYVENLDSLVGSYEGVVRLVAACCPACGGDVEWRSTHRHGCRPECPLYLYWRDVAAILREVGRRLHG